MDNEGGRRICVLLDSRKPMNSTKPIELEPQDVPMEDLKAAEKKVEREEGIIEDSDPSGTLAATGESSEASGSDLRKSSLKPHTNGNTDHIEPDGDEITVSPMQERRDIRFGDLPSPRNHERQNFQSMTLHLLVLIYST
jgi:hypothetical protein